MSKLYVKSPNGTSYSMNVNTSEIFNTFESPGYGVWTLLRNNLLLIAVHMFPVFSKIYTSNSM